MVAPALSLEVLSGRAAVAIVSALQHEENDVDARSYSPQSSLELTYTDVQSFP